MKKLSSMESAALIQLGMDFGHDVQGGCTDPNFIIEEFLNSKNLKDDIDVLNNDHFLEGLSRIAECCDCCGWYVEPCELNANKECADCAPEEDED